MIEVAILIAVHFLSCYYWYQAGKDKGRKEERKNNLWISDKIIQMMKPIMDLIIIITIKQYGI